MKEIDSPIIDMPTLRRDLYLVASLLLADKEVSKISDIRGWAEVVHENEVRRLMLWVTTALRGLLDLGVSDAEENEERAERVNVIMEQVCGEYWDNFPDGEQRPLRFRRACNSTIHAGEILLYRVPVRETKRAVKRAYSNRITMRSVWKDKTTRAQLDIIKFVRIANRLINHF